MISRISISDRTNVFKLSKNNNKNTIKGSDVFSEVSFKSNRAKDVIKYTQRKVLLKSALLSIAGFFGISVANKPVSTQDKIKNYNEKYPELVSLLNEEETVEDLDFQQAIPLYTDKAKIVILETFEKNPKLAYELTKKLKFDTSLDLNERIIDALINDYSNMKKYRGLNHQDTMKKIDIVVKNPRMESLASYKSSRGDVVTASNLALYSDYCVDSETTNALNKVVMYQKEKVRSWDRNMASENISIAEFYRKHPKIGPKTFVSLNKLGVTETTVSAIEKYDKEPERLEKYVKEYGLTGAEILLEYFEKYPKHLNYAIELKTEPIEIEKIINQTLIAEELLNEVVAINPELEFELNVFKKVLNNPSGQQRKDKEAYDNIANFIEKISKDDKEHYLRMNQDKRCCSLSQMQDLLLLYKKYPDSDITEEMIQNYNDPMRKAMGLY